MKTTVKATVILLFVLSSNLSVSAQFSKRNARDFINKTSYIIGEAYDVVYYYGYYSSGYLSKAVNHQNYAKYLYKYGNYTYAVYHSDLARTYALHVIYYSNNYWDNYYRPYYYSNNYNHGNHNKPPQNNHNQNVNYGHRQSTTNVSSSTRTTSNTQRVSKYAPSSSSESDLNTVDFNDWNRNYYSTEETSLLRKASMPSEKELETAVENNNNIRRVANDNDVNSNVIKGFSSDIDTYKRSRGEEARTISISRPNDLGTTPEVTRSTANTPATRQTETRPTETRPAETRPTETRPAETRPTQTREVETRPTQTRQTETPAQTRPTQTQPTETRPAETHPTQTRQTETSPTQTRQPETRPTQTRQPETRPTQTTTPSERQPSTRETTPQRTTTPTNQNNNNTQRR